MDASLLTPRFLARIADPAVKTVLLAGCGGGFDFVHASALYLAYLGDSRIYRFRQLQIEPMTRDHSLINDYRMLEPDLTEEELARVPRNVITRALGMRAEVEVAEASHPGRSGDLYLLCTDGIHGELDDGEIADVLRAHVDVTATVQALVQAALDHGGKDNIACVLVELGSG